MSTLPPLAGRYVSGMQHEAPAHADWMDPPGTISVDSLRRWAAVAGEPPAEAGRPLVICSDDVLLVCRAAVAGMPVDVIGSPNLPEWRRVILLSPEQRRLAGQ